MHVATPLPLGTDGVGPGQDEPGTVPAANILDPGTEATLGLLHHCVEAMSLLQAKFEALEVETKIKLDAGARELADMRGALAEAHSAIEAGGLRLSHGESRMAELETGAATAVRRHADDIAVARAEAATWRMRVETDAMGFDHLMQRLTAIEDGLSARLAVATKELVTQQTDNARLRTAAEAAEAQTDQLQERVRDLDATIADQRSRITSLHNKLATANYALRMEQMTRGATPAPGDSRDILDLQPNTVSRLSVG